MTENVLVRLFEHNNWANQEIIRVCLDLTDEQLDARPRSVTKGTIRQTLMHLVSAQRRYLALLTLPMEERPNTPLAFDEVVQVANDSGSRLLTLIDKDGEAKGREIQTSDGYLVDPWVVLLQAINHADEHREQISSMLTDLGITPPRLDGWSFGDVQGALLPLAP